MTLAALKQEIAHLPAQELQKLLHWLDEREQAAWDAQVERDFTPGGAGAALVEKMKAEARTGKFQSLEESRPG